MSAPQGAKPAGLNGADRAAAAALDPAQAPPTHRSYQRSRFPHLQQFAARGIASKSGQTLNGYQLRFGMRFGLQTGREVTLSFPRGMSGAQLATLFEDFAASLRAMVAECEAIGTDPRDQPAAKGDLSAGLPVLDAVASAFALPPEPEPGAGSPAFGRPAAACDRSDCGYDLERDRCMRLECPNRPKPSTSPS